MDGDALVRRDVRSFFQRAPGRWRPPSARGPDDGAGVALQRVDEVRGGEDEDGDEGSDDDEGGGDLEQSGEMINPLQRPKRSTFARSPRI